MKRVVVVSLGIALLLFSGVMPAYSTSKGQISPSDFLKRVKMGITGTFSATYCSQGERSFGGNLFVWQWNGDRRTAICTREERLSQPVWGVVLPTRIEERKGR